MTHLPTAIMLVAAFCVGVTVDRVLLSGRQSPPSKGGSTGAGASGQDGGADLAGSGSLAGGGRHRSTRSEREGVDGEEPRAASLSKAAITDLRKLVVPSDRRRTEERIHRAFDGGSAADFARLIGELGQGDRPGDRVLREHLYRRWADVDPAAALASVLDGGDFRTQRHVVHHAFREMARMDFGSAQNALAQLANHELRREAVHAMADSVGLQRPASFAGFLSSLPDAREFAGFFGEWATDDPGAAAGYVLGLDDAALRSAWIGGVASGWARTDAVGALEWVDGLPPGVEQQRARNHALEELARSEPAGAAAVIDALPPGVQQHELVEQVARMWGRQDLGAALEWADSLGGAPRARAFDSLLHQWAQDDPQGAAAYVEAQPVSERNLDALRQVAHRWARSDQDAALVWAASQENPLSQRVALSEVAGVWMQSDPGAAADFAVSLTPGETRNALLDSVARQWSEYDLAGAVGWLETLAAPDHSRAASGVIEGMAENDPAGAAALFEQIAPPDPRGTDSEFSDRSVHLAGEIAGRWSEFFPSDAAGWATGLPEGDVRSRAVASVADHWLRSDSLAASEWIGTLPQGGARDAATERLVDQIATTDPDAAVQWAMSVGSSDHQAELLGHVFGRWNATDAAAARAAFDAAAITPEQRERIGGVFH